MSNQLRNQNDTSAKQNGSSKKITLKLPAIDQEGLKTYEAVKDDFVHEKPELFTAFKMMIESTKKTEISDTEASMLREAMRRDEVTVCELNLAFWRAYKDQYTPSSGIEWRHLWKHIEVLRKGPDRKYYTYKEMLNTVDTQNITTDHFKFVAKDKWKRKL